LHVQLKLPSNTPGYPFILYQLLKERQPHESVEHKSMPTWNEHLAYLATEPHKHLYFIHDSMVTVGVVYITKRDEVGVFLFKDYRGRGYGPKAVNLLLKKHNERPLYANINPSNTRSLKLFSKSGFKEYNRVYKLI